VKAAAVIGRVEGDSLQDRIKNKIRGDLEIKGLSSVAKNIYIEK
jgi:hypothetical protein